MSTKCLTRRQLTLSSLALILCAFAALPFKKLWLSQSPHAPALMFGASPGLGGGPCPP